MRIVIDATTLLLESAGVKNYLYYWLRSLRSAALMSGDIVNPYPPALRVSTELDHRGAVMSRAAKLQLKLVQAANVRGSPLLDLMLYGADLFHCSQHTARLPRRVKTTATILDFS